MNDKERDALCHRIDELCMENEKLRKLNPLECALNAEQAYREQVDALVAEVKQLRNQHTARRITVHNHDTDFATGHTECSECHGTVNPCARFCEHCGALFKEGE